MSDIKVPGMFKDYHELLNKGLNTSMNFYKILSQKDWQ